MSNFCTHKRWVRIAISATFYDHAPLFQKILLSPMSHLHFEAVPMSLHDRHPKMHPFQSAIHSAHNIFAVLAVVMNADHQIHLVILLRNLLYKRTHFSFVFHIIKYILNPYYHKNWNLYLYNNANQSTIVVIDDLLHGVLQLDRKSVV